jgi:pimeloyl-ACP methyl ester carboxylesterase
MKLLPSFLLALSLLSACSHTPSSEGGASPETKSAELRTGVTLRYVEQGSGSGEPVIFLHGYTDSRHSFDLLQPILPRDLHAYLLDQRGHGDSERPECCYAQQDFAKDVVAFMDALGIQRATIVGHSMGSFIAQQVALESPERVRALVLIGSAPTANNEVIRGLNAEVARLQDPISPAFVRDFQASTVSKPVPDSYLATLVSESLKVPARVWKATLDGLIAENHATKLGSITAPTLVVGGELDSIFSVAEQRALASALPRSTLVLYPQVGHAPHAETPQRFVQDLTSFLRSAR